jgi:glycosyltransferase involved in cell wall biosynthesis
VIDQAETLGSASLISIVVTCYNQGRFLKDSLDSVLRQSHAHWECFIIDDGSTDETERIAQQYEEKDTRITYFFQPNAGVAAARNLAISKCKGDFIQFLDADDHLHKDKFTSQLEMLESNDRIDILYGSSRYFIDGEKDVLYPLHFSGSIPCDLTYRDNFQVEMLLKHNICTNCSALFRRKVLDQVRFRPVIFEDWVFNLECALNGFVFHFDNSFSSYSYIRITGSSQMIRHTNQVNEIRKFNAYLMDLTKEYQYPVSYKIIMPGQSGSSGNLVNFLRLVTPPFIFSFGSFLKRNLFS